LKEFDQDKLFQVSFPADTNRQPTASPTYMASAALATKSSFFMISARWLNSTSTHDWRNVLLTRFFATRREIIHEIHSYRFPAMSKFMAQNAAARP